MTGTGFPNAVPQDSSNRETGKKTTRSAIGAKAQTILDFLRQCTPYEADSIRVMVGHATGKGDTDTIEATDLLAVNRFLNHGLTKENATGNEAVMRHRQERAQKLMSNRNRYRMKLKRTRKHTGSCTPRGLYHTFSCFPTVRFSGCAGRRPMMAAGQQATSHCWATFWPEWLSRQKKRRASADRSCFQQVRHSIRRNSFPHNGTSAESEYGTCWMSSQGWGS